MKAIAHGANGYIVKPFNREDLLARVRRALESSEPVVPAAGPTGR